MSGQGNGAWTDAALEGAGNIVGVAAAYPFAGDPLAADMVAALVAPLTSAAIGSVAYRLGLLRERNLNAVSAVAADELDQSIQEMLRRIEEDPKLMSFFLRTLRAAEFTNEAEKILGLGRTLASVLEDEAKYDREQLVLKLLSQLEPPHFRLLAVFDRSTNEWMQIFTKPHGGAMYLPMHVIDALPMHALVDRSGLGPDTWLVADELVRWGALARYAEGSVQVIETLEVDGRPLQDSAGTAYVWTRISLGNDALDRVRPHGPLKPPWKSA